MKTWHIQINGSKIIVESDEVEILCGCAVFTKDKKLVAAFMQWEYIKQVS